LCTVKPADEVSVASCDSGDSIQLSTLNAPAPVPLSSSSSTLSEDCSSESGQCKPPPLVVSIDLELLRQEDPILDLVTPTIQQSPAKLMVDSDTESTAEGASGHIDNAADDCDSCTAVQNGVKILDSLDPALAVNDDDFESIYSRNVSMSQADRTTLEMSLDDAIMKNLMTSHPDDFRDVVRPVSFTEHPDSEVCGENGANVKSSDEEISVCRLITLPQTTHNSSHVSCSSSVNGTRKSMLVNHWVQLPAPANIRSLSLSSRHVWITDMSGQMFYSLLRGPGLHWFLVTTAPAQQVSVSPCGSLVWRLDSGSAYAARNVSSRQPWGNKWSEVARDVSWISVDDHVAW